MEDRRNWEWVTFTVTWTDVPVKVAMMSVPLNDGDGDLEPIDFRAAIRTIST